MTAFANDVELIESLDLMAVRQMRRVQTNEFSQVLSPSIITLTPKTSSARKQENLCQETRMCLKTGCGQGHVSPSDAGL